MSATDRKASQKCTEISVCLVLSLSSLAYKISYVSIEFSSYTKNTLISTDLAYLSDLSLPLLDKFV